jgi:hypothetical protein
MEEQKLGMAVHTCNLSTMEADMGGWCVQGQLGLNSEILSQQNKQKRNKGIMPLLILKSTVPSLWLLSNPNALFEPE